jgi:hypothetical protein
MEARDREHAAGAGTRYGQGSVALSLCTTVQPLHTIFTNILGASFSEATMRPNPRYGGAPPPMAALVLPPPTAVGAPPPPPPPGAPPQPPPGEGSQPCMIATTARHKRGYTVYCMVPLLSCAADRRRRH